MADKIFFCGRGPCEQPGAWAQLWSEGKVREYLKDSLAKAGVSDRPFERLRVERHQALDQDDTRVYIWGEDQPGISCEDYGQHEGLRVEIDGVVVYNDLRPAGDEDDLADHDPECEECAK